VAGRERRRRKKKYETYPAFDLAEKEKTGPAPGKGDGIASIRASGGRKKGETLRRLDTAAGKRSISASLGGGTRRRSASREEGKFNLPRSSAQSKGLPHHLSQEEGFCRRPTQKKAGRTWFMADSKAESPRPSRECKKEESARGFAIVRRAQKRKGALGSLGTVSAFEKKGCRGVAICGKSARWPKKKEKPSKSVMRDYFPRTARKSDTQTLSWDIEHSPTPN